jgi:hypothetical protein
MSRSDTLERAAGLPPLLVQVVKAALDAERFDPGNDRKGHADALVDFGQLAATAVPARGVLAPVDDVLYQAFEAVAVAHLGFGKARDALRASLQRVEKYEERDPIATAANDAKAITDEVCVGVEGLVGFTIEARSVTDQLLAAGARLDQ